MAKRLTDTLPDPDEHGNYKLSDGSLILTSSVHKKKDEEMWFIIRKHDGEYEVVFKGNDLRYFDEPENALKYLAKMR